MRKIYWKMEKEIEGRNVLNREAKRDKRHHQAKRTLLHSANKLFHQVQPHVSCRRVTQAAQASEKKHSACVNEEHQLMTF